jgi:hypothetical protein
MTDLYFVSRIGFGMLSFLSGVCTLLVSTTYFRRFNDSRIISLVRGERKPWGAGKIGNFFLALWLVLCGLTCMFIGAAVVVITALKW